MVHRVKKAEYVDEYKIKLKFKNGKIKIADLNKMIVNEKTCSYNYRTLTTLKNLSAMDIPCAGLMASISAQIFYTQRVRILCHKEGVKKRIRKFKREPTKAIQAKSS